MSIFKIRSYKKYKGISICRDPNVYGKEQVYIGNGQGCGTFWFENIKQARKFIDKYRNDMDVDYSGGVSLIPGEICKKCEGHYSYGTKEWKKYPDDACEEYKKKLKKESELNGNKKNKGNSKGNNN